MARTPPRRSRSTPRHQHKLNTFQHFIICNTAPISTVSMATYRQQQTLAVRTQIHQLMALLDEAPTEFANNDDFKHYHGIFEFCRSMVYGISRRNPTWQNHRRSSRLCHLYERTWNPSTTNSSKSAYHSIWLVSNHSGYFRQQQQRRWWWRHLFQHCLTS